MRIGRYGNLAVLLVILIVVQACEKNIFGPNEGILRGVVKDNHGKAIEGAKVTANYSDSENVSSISASTDDDGYYELEKVYLSENEVSVTALGFKTDTRVIYLDQKNNELTFNFDLEGSPTLASLKLSNNILDKAQGSADSTATLVVGVRDTYNSVSLTNYIVSAIIKTSDGSVDQIINLQQKSNSNTLFMMEAVLDAKQFELGTFTIDIEIVDPDGNTIQKQNQSSFDVV